MKETFVNNIEELMSANENQRIKINYLQSEKQKRQEYLSGLKESIMLNKQTLIVLNAQGPNTPALTHASAQNLRLITLNDSLYTQNRQLNALLLMEQQLRVQQRAFYGERINEFENRISELRKYLHDKEESFSAVVGRLKKYEEWNEKPLGEKIEDSEGLRKVTSEILGQVMAEKNMFKAKFEEVFPDAQRFKILSDALRNPKNLSRLISDLNQRHSTENPIPSSISEHPSPRRELISYYISQHKSSFSKQAKPPQQTPFKQNQMTKELMRLLKKQKLNNQILQTALHSAIQKNEQLLKINENLQLALQSLEKKMEKLIAQNYFYKMKVKEFAYGYSKKYVIEKVREESDRPIFQQLFNLKFQIKDQDNEEVSAKVYKDILKESLKEDIERILKVPIPIHRRPSDCCELKNQAQSPVKSSQEEERATQMTTQDNTRLNEKIVKGKARVEKAEKQRQDKQNEKKENPYKNSNIKISQKMMIRSASQPRMFIQWDQVEDESYHGEHHGEDGQEMVIEEF